MRCKKHKNQSKTSRVVNLCVDCQEVKLAVHLIRAKTKCETCGSMGKMFENHKWVCGKMDHKIDGFQLAKFKAFKREARQRLILTKPVETTA